MTDNEDMAVVQLVGSMMAANQANAGYTYESLLAILESKYRDLCRAYLNLLESTELATEVVTTRQLERTLDRAQLHASFASDELRRAPNWTTDPEPPAGGYISY